MNLESKKILKVAKPRHIAGLPDNIRIEVEMIKKLMAGALAVFLLVGTSEVSIADDCADGVIAFTTVPEIVINEQSCVIYQVTVEGRVEATNSPSFDMTFTEVGGPVTIMEDRTGTEQATVLNVDIVGGDLSVSGYESVVVAGNTVRLGNVRVDTNLTAFVQRNTVIGGNIVCLGNDTTWKVSA